MNENNGCNCTVYMHVHVSCYELLIFFFFKCLWLISKTCKWFQKFGNNLWFKKGCSNKRNCCKGILLLLRITCNVENCHVDTYSQYFKITLNQNYIFPFYAKLIHLYTTDTVCTWICLYMQCCVHVFLFFFNELQIVVNI